MLRHPMVCLSFTSQLWAFLYFLIPAILRKKFQYKRELFAVRNDYSHFPDKRAGAGFIALSVSLFVCVNFVLLQHGSKESSLFSAVMECSILCLLSFLKPEPF
jgi:hypothetical protein